MQFVERKCIATGAGHLKKGEVNHPVESMQCQQGPRPQVAIFLQKFFLIYFFLNISFCNFFLFFGNGQNATYRLKSSTRNRLHLLRLAQQFIAKLACGATKTSREDFVRPSNLAVVDLAP